MANLRVNNVVGFGSTDTGINFTGPIKLNTQGYMYLPTGVTTQRGRGRGLFGGGYCPNNTEEYNLLIYNHKETHRILVIYQHKIEELLVLVQKRELYLLVVLVDHLQEAL